MRDRESVSRELDRLSDNLHCSDYGQLYIGKCIKYLADTLYLIHLEKTSSSYAEIDLDLLE